MSIEFTEKDLEIMKAAIGSLHFVHKGKNDYLYNLWLKFDDNGVKDNFSKIEDDLDFAGNAIEELKILKKKLLKLGKG